MTDKLFQEMSMEALSELMTDYMEDGRWHEIRDLRVQVLNTTEEQRQAADNLEKLARKNSGFPKTRGGLP